MLDLDFVLAVHDEILVDFGGLPGFAHGGVGGVESALARVENHAYYNGVDDVFGIAALYAVAIAKGHVFNDANKRTGLSCCLTYLEKQEIMIPKTKALENIMVDVADSIIDQDTLAAYLSTIWTQSKQII